MLTIALVYDLRADYLALGFSEEATAEFDSHETIDAIEESLKALGYGVDRIGNLYQLVKRLANGEVFELVFNIAEGVSGLAREAQVPALLEAYNIPYCFSAPEIMIRCHDKSLAKQVVQAAGLLTSPFSVLHRISDLDSIRLSYPLFVKPLAEGTGKGISAQSLVQNLHELREQSSFLLSAFKQPVLVESFLPGREFTVGLLGTQENTKVLGVLEVVLNDEAESVGHTYHNKENCEALVQYHLVDDETAKAAAMLAKQCWQALACRDGGRIDIRCDAMNRPCFIEVNPLAGLHPTHSDLCILATKAGVDYLELIDHIVNMAISRYPHLKEKHRACTHTA